MFKEKKLQTYDSPQAVVILFALEQCIAKTSGQLDDWGGNNNYDEDF